MGAIPEIKVLLRSQPDDAQRLLTTIQMGWALTRERNEITNQKDERDGKPVARQLAPMISKFIKAKWNRPNRNACALPSTPLLLVLGQPYPEFPSYTKMSTSISSPTCIAHESLAHLPPCCPHSCLTQNCQALGIPHPRHLLGFDIYSALPTSARNTNTEPYLVRLATHKRDLCAPLVHTSLGSSYL